MASIVSPGLPYDACSPAIVFGYVYRCKSTVREASYKSRELTHNHPDLDMSDIVGDSVFGTRHALTQFKSCKNRGQDHLTNENGKQHSTGPPMWLTGVSMRRECESIVHDTSYQIQMHDTSSLAKLNANPGLETLQLLHNLPLLKSSCII